MEYTHVVHTFEPVFDDKSEILILGSFPSVKSRESQFYYGHPKNRFWKVTAGVLGEEVPQTVAEKRAFLLRNHIAVWDVIASCDIIGSSDSSIRNVVANDMQMILRQANIHAIYANGDKAYQLFLKYCKEEGQPEVYKLPSTSPANAAWSVERLIAAWSKAISG
ncbi:MAG: DNA-deoxyinosine glycosylase [Clostridiales bacterium]|nr:DNA-deoxyinosine glycosylase [Roseburia sp.]MDD7637584.1 DNA-deoxyinosine glycosylase [Clostridiales bacterium]MDY4112203.1 DNA-deoxyinosine glycosylase [Roseburia sp.]